MTYIDSAPSAPAAGRTPRRALRRLAATAGIVVGLAVLAEVALRLLGFAPFEHPMGPRHLHVRDPELGVALRPGARSRHTTVEFDVDVAVSSQGHRGVELGAKAPGELRILSLGDSIAFGYGVEEEETYAARLERALLASAVGPVRVVNAGVSSYGLAQMRAVLERDLDRVRPDLALCTFFFATDLGDAVGPALTERGGLVLSRQDAEFVDASPFLSFGMEHSELLLLLQYSYFKLRFGLLDPPEVVAADLDDPTRVYGLPALEHLRVGGGADADERWDEVGADLRALRETAAAAGIPLVLLNVPTRYQATPAVWSRAVETCGVDEEAYDVALPARRLGALCEAARVRCVDLTPDLREGEGEPPLYFEVNMHPNARGHARIATRLAEYLRGEGLVPR